MQSCPNCGMEITPGDTFCGTCGQDLQGAAAAAPPPAQPQFAPPPPPQQFAPPPAPQHAPPPPAAASGACPQCGMAVVPGDAFCGTCGHPAGAAPAPAPQFAPPPMPAMAQPPMMPQQPAMQAPPPPMPSMPPRSGMPPAPPQPAARPGMPPAPTGKALTPAEEAQQKKKGGLFAKKEKQPKPEKAKKEKPTKEKAAKAPREKGKSPASGLKGEVDKKKLKMIAGVLLLVVAGVVIYFMMQPNTPVVQPPPRAKTAGKPVGAPQPGAKPGAAMKPEEKKESGSQLITSDELKGLDNKQPEAAAKKPEAQPPAQKPAAAAAPAAPAAAGPHKGRFEDAIGLDDTAFAFAGLGGGDAGMGGPADELAQLDAKAPMVPEESNSPEPSISYDSYSSSGSGNSYSSSGSSKSSKSKKSKSAEFVTPTVSYVESQPAVPAYGKTYMTNAAPDAYGGRTSYDLYAWTPEGTRIGKSLTSTRDVFNGPGSLSPPGGGFSRYTEFHKVVVHETTNRWEAERVRDDLSADKRNLTPELSMTDIAGDTYYKVTVGHYTDRSTADNAANEIKAKGYKTRIETERDYEN